MPCRGKLLLPVEIAQFSPERRYTCGASSLDPPVSTPGPHNPKPPASEAGKVREHGRQSGRRKSPVVSEGSDHGEPPEQSRTENPEAKTLCRSGLVPGPERETTKQGST